jgi:hypothetical protein
MCLKHSQQKCLCVKKNKNCNINGIIDLSKLKDKEYVSNLYENGVLDGLYNIMQSVTQSLRSSTGYAFENIIESIFKKNDITYSSQVKLNDNHIVDFTIPCFEKNSDIVDFKGIIISCKTSLRERYLQDKYIKCETIYITMDQVDKKNVISLNNNKKTLDYGLMRRKKK